MNCSSCNEEIPSRSLDHLQDYKYIVPLDSYCNICLKQVLNNAVRQIEHNFDSELNIYAQLSLPLMEHLDYEIENGLFVFTKWYHIRRGNCCGSGCRNCAYK